MAAATARIANTHASGKVLRVVTEYSNSKGGYTLYVGSRQSSSLIRIYDKMAESGEERYTNAWRYEVECHGKVGTYVAEALTRTKGTVAQACSALVHEYCTKRGIQPIYSLDMAPIVVPSQEVPETDDQRALTWLRKQVKPTVDRLRKKGYTLDLLDIFELDRALFDPADNL